MSWCDDPLDLVKLLHWVFRDTAPPQGSKADAAYLFGEMPDSEHSVLGRGCALYLSGKAAKVALCYNRPDGGPYRSPLAFTQPAPVTYSGFTAWKKCLMENQAVAETDIVSVLPLVAPNNMLGTHLEAGGLVREARERGWQTVYIVDAPYHFLRAFVTTLKAMERESLQLKVYLAPGLPESWSQERSYGQVPGATKVWIDSLDDEWPRFDRYYKEGKGDIVSCKEALQYLRSRDA